jgi:NAD(P)-dependent dehydrogenase (short-subunit alcohol dehydrogenase family)
LAFTFSGVNQMPDEKVVLITGASSGIGRSIASLLFKEGYKVFGTSRKPHPMSPDGFAMFQLDVNDDESVKACISSLTKETGRIDVLINNAGYVITGAQEELPLEQTKEQFETNLFGAMRVTNEVLPIMRKQKSGRIINVGSIAGTLSIPFQGTYAATKSALLSYSYTLRQEVKGFGIDVSIIEPGYFNTEILNNSKTKINQIKDYQKDKDRIISKLTGEIQNGADPAIVANLVLKILQAKKPRFRYPVGKEKVFLIIKRAAPERVFEYIERRHWEFED